MCARRRPEGEDQGGEDAGGGEGVLQELQPDVGAQGLGHDARTDDGGEEDEKRFYLE